MSGGPSFRMRGQPRRCASELIPGVRLKIDVSPASIRTYPPTSNGAVHLNRSLSSSQSKVRRVRAGDSSLKNSVELYNVSPK